MSQLKSIDLFAGIGGIRLGFDIAFGESIKTVFVSEWDEKAQKTYLSNFKNTLDIAGDIAKIEESSVPQFDICLVGFPCQAFSLAGQKKGFNDDFKGMSRGTLFFDVARICSYHKPKVVFCENVKGLTMIDENDIRSVDTKDIPDIDILTAGFPCQPFSVMGKQKGFGDARGNLFFEISRVIDKKRPQIVFLENVKNLIEHDNGKTFLVIYNTLAQFGYAVKYKVLNACEYGNIPQDRSRIFIVAFLDYNMLDRFKFPEPLSLTKSINDIINRSERHHDIYYYKEDNPYFDKLNKNIKDNVSIYRIDDWGVAKNRYTICPTPKANMGTFPDRVPIIKDDFGIRKLTPKECLSLQGFPNDYNYPKISLNSAYKQAGNTVCVPVVSEIAKNIKAAL